MRNVCQEFTLISSNTVSLRPFRKGSTDGDIYHSEMGVPGGRGPGLWRHQHSIGSIREQFPAKLQLIQVSSVYVRDDFPVLKFSCDRRRRFPSGTEKISFERFLQRKEIFADLSKSTERIWIDISFYAFLLPPSTIAQIIIIGILTSITVL